MPWICEKEFKDISILYGASTVADLVYKNELEDWGTRPDVKLVTTVDPKGETPEWKGEVGFVPAILDKMRTLAENTIAIVCGPPVMIKYTSQYLKNMDLLTIRFSPLSKIG